MHTNKNMFVCSSLFFQGFASQASCFLTRYHLPI